MCIHSANVPVYPHPYGNIAGPMAGGSGLVSPRHHSITAYLRDVGAAPPSAGPALGMGAPATFASLMSALPVAGGVSPSQ